MMYDVIVVGGGIAGLYAAHKLCSTKRVLLLERDKELGGRAKIKTFKGTKVKTGAGVGRKHKDRRLHSLLQRLHIDTPEFSHTPRYNGLRCSVRQQFLKIKRAYENTQPPPVSTFYSFAISVLGKDQYETFVQCAGFSDFESADVQDVLYNYSFDDNYSPWTGFAVPWDELIHGLAADIERQHGTILRNCAVDAIRYFRISKQYALLTSCSVFYTRVIVIATAVDGIRALLPQVPLYRHVHSQPFLLVYAKVSEESASVMEKSVPGTLIVDCVIQKIIPVSKTIYLIAYCDNDSAVYLSSFASNTARNRRRFEKLLETCLHLHEGSITIDALKSFYHEHGTHYYDPLPLNYSRDEFIAAAQRPFPNIYVVGEAVSKHQGWTEGALESVDAVL